MTVPFSAIISPNSVSFTTIDGKMHSVDSSHRKWNDILDTIKEIHSELRNPSALIGYDVVASLQEKLLDLVNIGKLIEHAGAGKVSVRNGSVYYEDEIVNSAITERIVWGISEGFDMSSYMLFLDNVMDNTSKNSIDQLYAFMEKHNMGITDDGYVLGYKKITEEYKDIYTGKIDNSPGNIVEMKRNAVDDNPSKTCSSGLHFCSMAYLPHYGTGRGDRIVIVKVNPADIVSVPNDYNHAKVRCCKYEVLSEYTGSDVEDLLGTKAVWSESDFSDNADDSYYEDEGLEDSYDDDGDRCFECGEYLSSDDCDTDETPCSCDTENSDASIHEYNSEYINDIPTLVTEDEHIIEEIVPDEEETHVMRNLINLIQEVQTNPDFVVQVDGSDEEDMSNMTDFQKEAAIMRKMMNSIDNAQAEPIWKAFKRLGEQIEEERRKK